MEKRSLPVTFPKHRGLFNFSELLKAIREWYVRDDFTFHIQKHAFKIPTPLGSEQEIKFHGEKKVTGYVSFHIDAFIRVWDLRDVEIIKDGKKIKTNDGRVAIEITPTLVLDWQKRFGGSKFLQFLQDILHKYVLRYKISDYWEDKIMFKVVQLAKIIKERFGYEVA